MTQATPSSEMTPLIAERLLATRTVLLFGEINMALAQSVGAQLLALAAAGSDPIRLIIHSPGGHVESGDTLHDLIRFVEPEVHVLGTGWVASAGALIYAAAQRQHRYALPNTRFLLHEPLGGAGGPAADMEIEVQQIVAMRERIHRIFAEATGQSVETIARDTLRNHWLTAKQAVDYGLAGKIIAKASEFGGR